VPGLLKTPDPFGPRLTLLIFSSTIETEKINKEFFPLLPKIYEEPIRIDSRLTSLGLDRGRLVRVALQALGARNDAVSIDPVNAAGLLAYIYGTRAIREYLLPKGWQMDRSQNIEATVDPTSGTRLIYQNCDLCCVRSREPRTISTKGLATSQLLDQRNGDLFPELLEEQLQEASGKVWFLCVSMNDDDVRAELSCPTKLEGKQFSDFRERIFLIRDGDLGLWPAPPSQADHEDEAHDYEVIVTKKDV